MDGSKSKYISYSDENLKEMKSIQIFKGFEKEINSIDFFEDGNFLVASSKDDSICFYSVPNLELIKKLYNKTYGCENAVFTHNKDAILCSSNKDFRIMYWNIYSNEVLYSFLGHSDLIIDITMCPKSDLFLTTSRDKTSRLWDLGDKKCLAIFHESNFATFDKSGVVIASVNFINGANNLNLYDEKNIKNGPFQVFKIDSTSVVRQLRFSNDGTIILCNTEDNLVIAIDSYDGNVLKKITAELSSNNDIIPRIDISPDSKYVCSGTESGNIVIWNLQNEKIVESFEFHPLPTMYVKFNPVYNIIASACQNIVLWQINDVSTK